MNVTGGTALRMLGKGLYNTARKYPLSISIEVTHACTANCWHCNWGGPIKETRRTPAEYAEIVRGLSPVIVNVSGGEPMARGDLDDIVRAVSRPGRLPWIVVVSNGSQLSPERFMRLKKAGAHQLSLSIDFPDDRHSDFRRIPGLFAHLDEMVPKCVAAGDADDINLNCCITSWNYMTIADTVRLAARWGVSVNFSAYTPLRMDDASGLVKDSKTAQLLTEKVDEVIALKKEGYPVYTSERVLRRFRDFLIQGKAPGCQAGYRFLVVNPDGRMTPCAMVMAYYDDHQTMQKEFSTKNTCEACFISTRANTEKTIGETFAENRETLESWLPWNWGRRRPQRGPIIPAGART